MSQGNSWESNYYAKKLDNEILKLVSEDIFYTDYGVIYSTAPQGKLMSWSEQGNSKTPCNNICKATLGSSYSGYCVNPSSIDTGQCCSCSTINHNLDKTLSWDQPIHS